MDNLSIVIITLNEEKNIGRCLASIKDLSDDIIIVDSFSTDRTKAIAEQFENVQFIQKEWLGYGATKNFGNSLAKNKWILSLDADEEISTPLANKIEAFISKGNADAYRFSRLVNYCGKWIKHGSWFPDHHIRLFKKHIARWDNQEVHEQLVLKKGAKIHTLKKVYLHHYTHDTFESHLQTVNKYSTLSALKMFRLGKKVNFIKCYLAPTHKFIVGYIIRGGFLDGFEGYMIAKTTAYESFIKYAKLRQLNKK